MTLKNYAEYSTVQLSSRAKAFSIDALLHDQSTNFSRMNKNSATEGKCAQSTTSEKPLETSLYEPSKKDLVVEEIGFRQFPQFCVKPENPFTDSTCRKYGTGVPTTVGSALDTHITVELCRQDLWKKFHLLGNEMIITKAGRRLFPALKVKISGLHPDGQYSVWIDIVPVDSNRYRYMYSNSRWMVAGKGNQLLERTRYIHPDSPANGRQWMAQTVSFEKMKLTNNKHPMLRGQVVIHSMHKYQPTIYIERVDNIGSSKAVEAETAEAKSFVFPETSFFTVTAYQNQQITKLKIASNPFAKGFREASKYRDSDPHILTQCSNVSMKDHDATSVTFTPRTSFCGASTSSPHLPFTICENYQKMAYLHQSCFQDFSCNFTNIPFVTHPIVNNVNNEKYVKQPMIGYKPDKYSKHFARESSYYYYSKLRPL